MAATSPVRGARAVIEARSCAVSCAPALYRSGTFRRPHPKKASHKNLLSRFQENTRIHQGTHKERPREETSPPALPGAISPAPRAPPWVPSSVERHPHGATPLDPGEVGEVR